jgi:pimeloyl-ACP methyl ester carboxylesterase
MIYTVKDLQIYYEIHGSGTPLITIHGWGVDHRLMKGCMEPALQSTHGNWQRIYFDLPGMGRTPGRPWITGSDRMLEIIMEFIDGIIPDKNFVLAGQSYGGYLARGLLNKRFSRILGLLLLCPSTAPWTVTNGKIDKGDVPVLSVLEKDETFLAGLSAKDRNDFGYLSVIQNKRTWNRYSREILPGVRAADNRFLDNTLGQNVPFGFPVDRLQKPFTNPTLILLGRQDSAVGYRDQWKFIENYPRASYVVLDKAGHSLQTEQETLFTALVSEWLDRILKEGQHDE